MDWSQLIGTLGFPIIISGVLLYFFSQWLRDERSANIKREEGMAERITRLEERDNERATGLIRECITTMEGVKVRDEMIIRHLQSCTIGEKVENALDKLTERLDRLQTIEKGK